MYFELILYAMLAKGPTWFFFTWTSSFPSTICRKDYPFPIECFWHSCQKSFDYICKGLFLGSFIGLNVFMLVSQCFGYCSIVVKFWNQEGESCKFVLSQDGFGYGVPWDDILTFRMDFPISTKNVTGILKRLYWICTSLWLVLTF